ncbi:MAG: VOC family protein [Armatimonadetes bacterium]|nr:MAG: VOC family protein [Armatimonadota bacterium]
MEGRKGLTHTLALFVERVDHLLYATPDVEATIAEVSELFGIGPVVGGRHPGLGTRNALIRLGPRRYFEIIGPDPDREFDGLPTVVGLDTLETPRLASWAAHSSDIETTLDLAATAGIDLGDAVDGMRETTDGTVLSWMYTDPYRDRLGGAVPFFIDWGTGAHPADDLPDGCSLTNLVIEHPNPDAVKTALQTFGIQMDVSSGPMTRLVADIETPNGSLRLD